MTRSTSTTRFVGVDGEGWTDVHGEHHYAQLSVGDWTLFRPSNLDFEEICAFLWDAHLNDRTAAYVGFFLGYDFSQWFKTLPEGRASMLLSADGRRLRTRRSHQYLGPFPVHHAGWEFDVLGMKRFKLRPQGEKNWMYVCDVGSFFQSSFVSVIDPGKWPDGAVCTEAEYQVILDGKANRAVYDTQDKWLAAQADLTLYNQTENEILARVMGRYETGLRENGVKLSRDQWYGPGAAAQKWLDLKGVPRRTDLEDAVPRDVLEFARESYYGGWFEVFAHGVVPGESFEYDIVSAYPYAQSVMPEFTDCDYEWMDEDALVHVGLDDLPVWCLVDADTRGSDPICGAGLHRTKVGRILRPSQTRGVRWAHELRSGVAAGTIESGKFHRALVIRPRNGSVLNVEVPELFSYRSRIGKNTAAGKGAKLLLNSTYGKTAQSIGSPKFSNPLAASFTTSWCRTMILNAIASHPQGTRDLLMVATDAVYFKTRHPGLEQGSGLGQWEEQCKSNLTIVMPGVHFDDQGRKGVSSGNVSKLRSRGIPASGLSASIADLDAGFDALTRCPNDPSAWPVLDVPIRFQVQSPTSALAQGNWSKAGRVSRDVERKLSTDPSAKRVGPAGDVLFAERLPYVDVCGAVRTWPHMIVDDGRSVPYSSRFGLSEDDQWPNGFDGSVQTELMEMLGGEDSC